MGEILDVEIRLGVEAIPLEPLEVLARRSPMHGRIARFESRMNDPGRAGGYFITEQEIDGRMMSTPSRLVLTEPSTGVSPVGGAFGRSVITLRRGCLAQVYVDGVRMRQTEQHTVDDILDTELVGGVGVYPSPYTAPIEY